MAEKQQYPQIPRQDAAAVPDAAAAPTQGFAPHQQPQPSPYPAPPIYIVQQPPPAPPRAPLISIISPEDAKKIRKMQMVHLFATMLQLGCCLAVILIVRYHLAIYSTTRGPGGVVMVSYTCYMATPSWSGACDYAYSLAAVSIFWSFVLSMMQCLTMDCCGMGRAVEAGLNTVLLFWWTAGAATLGNYAAAANNMGIPAQDARNAVVAMAAICAFTCLSLLVVNVVLIKRLGKAYKSAVQQQQLQQQWPVAHPHMQQQHQAFGAPAGAVYQAPVTYYQAQPGMHAPAPAPAPPGAPGFSQPPPAMAPQGAPMLPPSTGAAHSGAASPAGAAHPTNPQVIVVQQAPPTHQPAPQQRSGIRPVHLLLAHRMGRRAARRR